MKQMLRFKKTRTWLPLFLAFLLTFLAVPFAASAEDDAAAFYPSQLLLRMDALDEGSVVYYRDYTDQTIANLSGGNYDNDNNNSFTRGTTNKSDILVNPAGAGGIQGGFGVSTGLNLSASATTVDSKKQWTVEFYVKIDDKIVESGTHFIFGIRQHGVNDKFIPFPKTATMERAFLFQNDGKAINYLANDWNLYSTNVRTCEGNFWADNRDENGYTRIVIVMGAGSDGWIKFYCGETIVEAFSSSRLNNITSLDLFAGFFRKDCSSTATGDTDTITYKKGDVVGSLKDISVYTGAYSPAQLDELNKPTPAVRFEKADGTLIEKRELVDGSLTVNSFPEITSDKTVCWFNKETGELVRAGATFEADTVLVAREFGSNESILLAAQNATPADGKVNARFVGGVWDLTGDSIGFDIQVTYTDESGKEVVEKYRRSGSSVYTSVLAAGETYTANKMGVMYLFALSFEEIPAQGTITFQVKTFKEAGGIRIYGEGGTFTMTDGAFTEPLSPNA